MVHEITKTILRSETLGASASPLTSEVFVRTHYRHISVLQSVETKKSRIDFCLRKVKAGTKEKRKKGGKVLQNITEEGTRVKGRSGAKMRRTGTRRDGEFVTLNSCGQYNTDVVWSNNVSFCFS